MIIRQGIIVVGMTVLASGLIALLSVTVAQDNQAGPAFEYRKRLPSEARNSDVDAAKRELEASRLEVRKLRATVKRLEKRAAEEEAARGLAEQQEQRAASNALALREAQQAESQLRRSVEALRARLRAAENRREQAELERDKLVQGGDHSEALANRLRRLQAENADLREKVVTIDELERRLAAANARVEAADSRMKEDAETLARAQQNLAASRIRIEALEMSRGETAQRVARFDALEEELRRTKARAKELDQKLERANKVVSASQSEVKELRAQLDRADGERTEALATLNQTRQELAQANSVLERTRAERDEAKSEADEGEREIAKLETEISKLRKRLATATARRKPTPKQSDKTDQDQPARVAQSNGVFSTANTTTNSLTRSAGRCGLADLVVKPLPGGQANVLVTSSCRAGQGLVLDYADVKYAQKLDTAGRAGLVVDMFAGASVPATISFVDGQTQQVTLPQGDLDEVIKIALVWNSPVDLDLHALEYAARRGESGHVWAKNPKTAAESRDKARRTNAARGFLSRADNANTVGDKVEVYTIWRVLEQRFGSIGLLVDDVTRGSMPEGKHCGDGELASVPYRVIRRVPGRPISIRKARLSPLPCDSELSDDYRYNRASITDLDLRR